MLCVVEYKESGRKKGESWIYDALGGLQIFFSMIFTYFFTQKL